MQRVLIVEDNEMNLDMLSRRLSRLGYIIASAENGQLALQQAETLQPEIILMDMSLPVMDGWEATRQLKANQSTSHIPVIGLSAHARDSDIIRGLEAGCDAYHTKPINFAELLKIMDNLLDSNRIA